MAGRIRTLKPEWLDDSKIAMASDQARILSVALILLADDHGNGRANVVQLAGRVFPGRPVEVTSQALEELVRVSFVILYSANDQPYFTIRSWAKHQRIDRPGKPRVPAPPELTDGDQTIRESLANIRESLAKVPAILATDLDLDPDLEGRGSGPTRAREPEPWLLVAKEYRAGYLAARVGEVDDWQAHAVHREAFTSIARQAQGSRQGFGPGLGAALANFFADDFARKADFPPGLLAKQFARFLAPPRRSGGMAPPAPHDAFVATPLSIWDSIPKKAPRATHD